MWSLISQKLKIVCTLLSTFQVLPDQQSLINIPLPPPLPPPSIVTTTSSGGRKDSTIMFKTSTAEGHKQIITAPTTLAPSSVIPEKHSHVRTLTSDLAELETLVASEQPSVPPTGKCFSKFKV